MQLSIAGLFVSVALMALGYWLRAPIVIGLFASLPFGATAIATLPMFGGSSPLIFVVFVILLLVSISMNCQFVPELSMVFQRNWTAWVACVLALYAIAGAELLPRIFMGQTDALVPIGGQIFELPLMPVSGNITQPAYFALGSMTFLALSVLLAGGRNFDAIRAGFFTWAVLHVILGFLDWAATFAGAGDILAPIRTASYTMLNDVEEVGFHRITGAYSEASAFGGASLACLAFTFTYWRKTGSTSALALAFMCLVLLLLSTSSSAYVGGAIIAVPVLASIGYRIVADEIASRDLVLLVLMAIFGGVIISAYLYSERAFDPIVELFESALTNKAASASGQERAYWNYVSLQSFFDTGGLGIGMGSSRASSWPVAVMSQLGFIGALLQAALLIYLVRGMGGGTPTRTDREHVALAASVRASALAALVGSTIAGTSADPGLLFFIALAVVSTCRQRVLRSRMTGADTHPITHASAAPVPLYGEA